MEEDFDAVAWINTPRWQGSRLGLARMTDLLERLGRPQDVLRFVHVAGTNGKGSTCAFLASVLQAAGYKVGLFTSPFIECFEERIQVNGANISPGELACAVAAVRPAAEAVEAACGDHPTEFELMAAVAFEHFRAVGCDIVVLEVGLGGRLDATNVIDRCEASVICRIGLDHTDLLGATLAAVAGEKAGIAKPGCPVVSWPQDPEAMAVVEEVAAEKGCSVTVPDFAALAIEPFAWRPRAERPGSDSRPSNAGPAPLREFSYRGEVFQTRLLGSYQPANAALALECARVLRERGWDLPDAALFAGIAEARWPGRFEVVASDPLTIVDGGHNPQGAEALADSLADLLGEEGMGSVDFVMGVLADKDYPAMVRAVLPWARTFTTYTPENPRALAAEALAACIAEEAAAAAGSSPAIRVAGGTMCPVRTGCARESVAIRLAASPAEAMCAAREAAGGGGTVVAFGTLYAIADLRKACRPKML